jgi:Ca2+-transporting ATPase
LVTDGFLDIALAGEPHEVGLLSSRWLSRKLKLIDRYLFLRMIFFAIPMGLISTGVYWWYYCHKNVSLDHARTITLVVMAMFQWFNAWNCRSEYKSVTSLGFFSNKWLIAALILVFTLQLLLVYNPSFQGMFRTVPLSLNDWILAIIVSIPVIVFEELRKFVAACLWPELKY